jgi:osmoprotectant transport system ATP-binding protein
VLPAVEFREARVERGERFALGPLTLAVTEGESLVLLGESGSGKTTALRLINALLYPGSGAVAVMGRETTAWDPVRLRRSIGYVIQEIGLLPHLTVAENVGLVPRLLDWPAERIRPRVAELLALVGLGEDHLADRHPHELSGGQRQRVGVARALAADPPIILCDEPFGALDPVTRHELRAEFRDLVRRLGKTVIFVTHDLGEARTMGDRIALLENGVLRFLGSVQEFQRTDDTRVVAFRGDW